MSIYNSKKISELRARNVITKHQENSWIPIAQYNERTDSYTNITMPIKAITDYSYEMASAYTVDYANVVLQKYYIEDWLKLHNTGNSYTSLTEMRDVIDKSGIASNVMSYTFAYSLDYFMWQKFI